MRLGQTSVVHFFSEIATAILGFLATIYIAHALGPRADDTFGVYFLIVAVVIWLRVFTGLGLQTALKKRLSEGREQGQYLVAGLILQFSLFGLLAGLLVLAEPFVREYLRGVSVGVIIALLFAVLALHFVSGMLDGWHLVHISSLLKPLERLLRSGIQILTIFLGYELAGLFVGYGIAAVGAAVVGALYLGPNLKRPRRRHVVDLLGYAKYAWLTSLSSRAFASMDTIVLGLFVADGFIGVYEIAWNLASILAVFGASVARTLFPAISELSDNAERSEVEGLVTDSLRYAGLFLFPGFVGAAILQSDVLRIYGAEFTKGGTILVVLVGARLVYTYQAQFVNTLNAINRPDLAFRVEAAFVLANLSLNLALVWQYGWVGAAVATAVSATVGLVLGYFAVRSVLTLELPTTELARQMLAALVMGVVVLAGDLFLPGTLPVSIGIIFAGSGFYGVVLYVISPDLRRVIRSNLPRAGRGT